MPKPLVGLFTVVSAAFLLPNIVALAAVGNSIALAPPAYDTFVPPARGASYADPTFGTTVKRLSDALIMTDNAAGSGRLTTVGTEYSTSSPFNRDNSRMILQHNSYFGLYDGNGTYLKDLPFAVNVSTEPRWSRTDANVLFYVTGNSLKRLDVSSGTSTLVRTFSEYSTINGKGESDISRDGDHFVFAGNNRYVFVYEISSGAKSAVLDTAGHPFDDLYIASNNSVAVGWIPNGSARYQGVELFDRNMNFVRQLTHALGHMHLTSDTDGSDVLIWTNSNDSQPIACQNGIVKVRLSDARQTCLLELDWSLAVHITAADGDGWAFVETYAPGNPLPQSSAWAPFANEILRVRLDGSRQIQRLVHHRSRPFDSYVYQPKATVSRDGTRLAFTSNQNLQAILGYPTLYTDAYLVNVGGSTPTPTPTPTPGASTTPAAAASVWHDFFALDARETPEAADFNGDGKADIVTFARDNPAAPGDVYVALSNGTTFGASTKWHDWLAVNQDEAVVIGDYNGDGKADVATWLSKGTKQIYVALSNGARFTQESVWLNSIGVDSDDIVLSGDANGDLKSDLILFARKQGKVCVALSDGVRFGAPAVWHNWFAVSAYERPRVADVNGDGKVDIVTFASDSPTARGDVYVATSNGGRFVDLEGVPDNSSKWHDWFAVSDNQAIRIGDLNGDHKDDFLTFLPAPFSQCYTALSQGTSLGGNVLWREGVVPLLGAHGTVRMGDVNGDGKDDMILFAQAEGKVYVSLTQ